MRLVEQDWALLTAATSECEHSNPANVGVQCLELQHPYVAATVLEEWYGIQAWRARSSAHIWDRITCVSLMCWPGLSPLTMRPII